MHKIMHGQGELDSEHWFDKIGGERITRAGNDPLNIKCRGGKLEVRRNFFSNRIEKPWNSLPKDRKSIRKQKSLNVLAPVGSKRDHLAMDQNQADKKARGDRKIYTQ
jgi:hypothetical protein